MKEGYVINNQSLVKTYLNKKSKYSYNVDPSEAGLLKVRRLCAAWGD